MKKQMTVYLGPEEVANLKKLSENYLKFFGASVTEAEALSCLLRCHARKQSAVLDELTKDFSFNKSR